MLRPFTWTVPTRVLHAPGGGGTTVGALVGTAAGVVVSDQSVLGYAEAVGDRIGAPVLSAPSRCGFTEVAALSEELRRQDPAVVVAIGGGTVLDLARLAALAVPATALATPGGWSGNGLRRRDPTVGPRGAAPRVVAVPSTVGTGAEVSALAVIEEAGQPLRTVVADPGLHPVAAILDFELLETLPPHTVRGGLLETLGRVLGPALADEGGNRLADELAAGVLRRALALSADLTGMLPEGRLPAEVLSEAAWLATMTATQVTSVGRSVSDSPLWLLQHAVSGRARVGKTDALRSLLPLLLGRVAAAAPTEPIITSGACRRLAGLVTGAAVDADRDGAAALLGRLQDSGILSGPQARMDPEQHAADLVAHGFTEVGGLQGQQASSLAHVLTPVLPSQPSPPNGSR